MFPHLEQTVLLHPIYVQSYEGLRKNENKEIHLETVSNVLDDDVKFVLISFQIGNWRL